MICQDCRDAGMMNAEAGRLSNAKLAKALRTEAKKLHARCGGRCDCQHRIGEGWMNPERIGDTRDDI